MIPTLAWRNIWRNPTRSLVVIGAITIGIFSVIFMMAFSNGMVQSFVNNAIESQTSHIQIHHKNYNKEKSAKYVISDIDQMIATLEADAEVKSLSARTLATGMLTTSRESRGVMIRGVNPEKEAITTNLDKKIKQGTYFEGRRNPMLISTTLAKKLNVDISEGRRPKFVLRFQDIHGEITSGNFRVDGVYDTGNNQLDEMNVYVRDTDLKALLGLTEQEGHEVAILVKDVELLENTTEKYQKIFNKEEVANYRDISKTVKLSEDQMGVSSMIITVIFMIALVFGIINTMLMAILERIRELGMLMAIGMNKFKVFGMIVTETVMMCLIGAPVGILVGHLAIKGMSKRGLDLSAYSEGMREFGMSEVVYPSADSSIYITVAIGIVITAIVGALYPAFKAIRLKPVEALHKI